MDKPREQTKTVAILTRSKGATTVPARTLGSIASGNVVLSIGQSSVVRSHRKEDGFIIESPLSGVYCEWPANRERSGSRQSSPPLSINANLR